MTDTQKNAVNQVYKALEEAFQSIPEATLQQAFAGPGKRGKKKTAARVTFRTADDKVNPLAKAITGGDFVGLSLVRFAPPKAKKALSEERNKLVKMVRDMAESTGQDAKELAESYGLDPNLF